MIINLIMLYDTSKRNFQIFQYSGNKLDPFNKFSHGIYDNEERLQSIKKNLEKKLLRSNIRSFPDDIIEESIKSIQTAINIYNTYGKHPIIVEKLRYNVEV